MDQPWYNVFDNSMRQPWFYFCYGFDVSVMNSMTLSIAYGSCHSVLNDDLTGYSDSGFSDDLWICTDIAFLTIPCVNLDSIFAIDSMSWSWIHWRCRFHTSAVTQFSVTLFIDQQWHSIFDNSMHRPWLYFCYRFDASVVNSVTLLIP